MREYEYIIDQALKNGLSPEPVIAINSPFLEEALGFRCGRKGMEAYPVGTNPLPVALDLQYEWPWPQYIRGERYNFLAIRDVVNQELDIYHVSDDNLTVTFVFSIDDLTFGLGGTILEVADFGEYAFMTDGRLMVYWNVAGAWNSILSSATVPRMGTICNFKGQAVGGNVKTAWYDCDEKSYLWSKIGSLDFTPGQDNEAGYRRDPFGGIVRHTRRLGEFVVGYSSEGVIALEPISAQKYANNLPQTFGFRELSGIGIRNMGAMNGDLNRQIYVGNDLVIREITSQGVKDIGYYLQMEDLDDDGEDIIVTFDRAKGDFFIGNSTKTYLLSPYGMTNLAQHPSAVWRTASDKVHMLPDTEDAGWKHLITSGIFDLTYRGQKTIFTVETDAVIALGAYASVDWANDLVSWGYGAFTPINNMGIATAVSAGNMFRINLRFDQVFDLFRIGYIKARFKMTDLRGLRGVYAPPLRGQSAE